MTVEQGPQFDPNQVPLRERTGADHDEPWQYQPYHLGDREKLNLLRRRERMLAGEFTDGDPVGQDLPTQKVVFQQNTPNVGGGNPNQTGF